MKIVAAVFGLAVLVGCTTTEDANKAIQSQWIGRPSDQFFSQYGMPLSSFTLDNGGTIYRWRGGVTTQNIPAQYRTVDDGADKDEGYEETTTTVTEPDYGTTVTETTTTRVSLGRNRPRQVLVSPARTETLFCEAQITVDQAGIVQNIQATNDTTGEGLSLSRCAEVFGVKK